MKTSFINSESTYSSLRNILASIYDDEESARRIAADAGLNLSNIKFSSKAIDNWYAVLREAGKANRIDALLNVVITEYPRNEALKTAYVNSLNSKDQAEGANQTIQTANSTGSFRMILEKVQSSVVIITSGDLNNRYFGTGFVIRCVSGAAYVVTCTHVVNNVGGADTVRVDDLVAKIVAVGESDGLDLAVLRVDGLFKPELTLTSSVGIQGTFLSTGFLLYENVHVIRSLRITLGKALGLYSKHLGGSFHAWDLEIVDEQFLHPGYSGAPVVDESNGQVLGIVKCRSSSGEQGLVISIVSLEKLWKFVDSNELYRSLLKLGYKRQVRLFRQLFSTHSVAALLIYGPPDHGQRWLLNLLLAKHLPSIITSRVMKVGLNRSGRKFDAKAIWRELSRHLNIPPHSSFEEIVQRVHQCWQTQNVILIFHNVDWIPSKNLQELINEFWLPLTQKIQVSPVSEPIISEFKLLMFLIDYEGNIGSLEDYFTHSIDSPNPSSAPVKFPKISRFSEDELFDWVENESDELPDSIMKEVDNVIQEIMDYSGGGIPELTLEEICARCDCNWYEESEKWLKY